MKNVLRSIDADWEEDEMIIVGTIPEFSNSMSFECYVNGKFKRYLFNVETSVYHHDYGVVNGVVRGRRYHHQHKTTDKYIRTDYITFLSRWQITQCRWSCGNICM